ncbi:MAG TPA: hypothetical protein VGM56_25770 [Byssovorax sp.]|jgi:hypothetical protein
MRATLIASSLFAAALVAGCGSTVDSSDFGDGATGSGGATSTATTTATSPTSTGSPTTSGEPTGAGGGVTSTATTTTSTGTSGHTYPSPHPGMPQIPNNGGVTLHDPVIVTITFPGDADASFEEGFGDAVGGLAWWNSVTSEYGVGPATNGGHVRITDALPGSMYDSDLQSWIDARIADGTLPAPTDQTLYALYMPNTTSISFSPQEGGGSSCREFLGYHNTYGHNDGMSTTALAYAVIDLCSGSTDDTTDTASHEFAEAATDPHPAIPGLAYMILDDTPWTLDGGEVADMCDEMSSVQEAGYNLTRSWSNANAAIGQQPCQPAPPDPNSTPYFNTAPDTDTLSATPGTSVTVNLHCYSFGPLANPMQLMAQAYSPDILTFSFDHPTCVDGDVVVMTVDVAATAQHGTPYHFELLPEIDADTGHLWRGEVQVN